MQGKPAASELEFGGNGRRSEFVPHAAAGRAPKERGRGGQRKGGEGEGGSEEGRRGGGVQRKGGESEQRRGAHEYKAQRRGWESEG